MEIRGCSRARFTQPRVGSTLGGEIPRRPLPTCVENYVVAHIVVAETTLKDSRRALPIGLESTIGRAAPGRTDFSLSGIDQTVGKREIFNLGAWRNHANFKQCLWRQSRDVVDLHVF